ncbi:GH92 family glycosyl hydrolase [Rhodanobacter sp. L36]|uniref:GH92 family glycosyl hydrolase n=1 Tax=Rhodanobacter sp. L36 TaxID=1747221 RepID=UPI00131CDE3D|nr:GH92 family glycosyl hydrolase [Rhodanobacter sp. L36]
METTHTRLRKFLFCQWRNIAALAIIGALACANVQARSDVATPTTPVDWVNTFIGTGGGGVEYGGTMPLVTTPFGMTNWTAQTRQNRISVSSYAYEDTYIQGFIGTHQPAIWMGDYGYVTLMPEIGSLNYAPEARRLAFTHNNETSTPYYYAVTMGAGSAHRIVADMTATDHAGYLRFTYPKNAKAGVLIEATRPGIKGFVSIDSARHEVSGYNPDRMDANLGPLKLPNFKGYFVVRFKQSFSAKTVYEGVLQWPGKNEVDGINVGAFVSFDTSRATTVEAQVGTSFISIEQARANLDAEMPNWNFDATRDALKATWNAKLGIASLQGASDDQRRMFYTGLYHALLYPKLFSEHGRYYSAFDDKVHNGTSYTAYSIWDTFRAENSLLTLFAPERIDGMVQALLQDYVEGGWMPKWPDPSYTNIMIGTHADSLVAEAIDKGFRGFDLALAYKAVYKDAMTPPDGDTTRRWFDREPYTPYEARAGLTYMKNLGYIPADKVSESASSTQEESYDDFAVAQVAKAVGKSEDHAFFLKRSLSYRNLFNPARGFMQAKNADGHWASPDEGWTEGDQWVYLFAALHDIPGVVKLLGGRAPASAKLDAHFDGGHNRHDNEPSHHYAYLYDYTGEPWKTQARVRMIAHDAYSNTPNGVLGNEDCGQMSAWYLFTAMGFYPVNPASGDYLIGSPLFARVTLNLPNGKTFVVSSPGNSATNIYIQSARLNGKPLDVPVVSYAQIEAGGQLDFVMGPKPSRWGANWHPLPLDEMPTQH